MLFGVTRIFFHCRQEMLGLARRRDLPAENFFEGNELPVENPSLILVLRDGRSVEIDSSEEPTRTGIGQNFSLQLPIRVSSRVTAYWSGCGRRVGTQLELAGQQMLHSLVIGDDHHQVHGLAAKLKSPASARDGNRGRSTPFTVFVSASRYTLSMTPAKADGDFHHGWDHRDALRFIHYFVRDRFVRGGHDFFKDLGGIVDPLLNVRFVCAPRQTGG